MKTRAAVVRKMPLVALILGCICTFLVSAPVPTQAFVITLDPENVMILEPTNGMVLRPFLDPSDDRLGQSVLQVTYEPKGVPDLFNLVGITVATGSLNVGIQYEDGTIAVYNDLTAGVWPLDGDSINRVTLECPSGGSCPSTEVLLQMFRVQSLEIEPIPELLEARFCCNEQIRGKLPSGVKRGYTGCAKILGNKTKTCADLGRVAALDIECTETAWNEVNGVLYCY